MLNSVGKYSRDHSSLALKQHDIVSLSTECHICSHQRGALFSYCHLGCARSANNFIGVKNSLIGFFIFFIFVVYFMEIEMAGIPLKPNASLRDTNERKHLTVAHTYIQKVLE